MAVNVIQLNLKYVKKGFQQKAETHHPTNPNGKVPYAQTPY